MGGRKGRNKPCRVPALAGRLDVSVRNAFQAFHDEEREEEVQFARDKLREQREERDAMEAEMMIKLEDARGELHEAREERDAMEAKLEDARDELHEAREERDDTMEAKLQNARDELHKAREERDVMKAEMKELEDARDRALQDKKTMDDKIKAVASVAQTAFVQWHFCDGGSDYPFQTLANHTVQKAHHEGKSEVDVDSGRFSYTINFRTMQQKNKETGKTRSVKRVVLSGNSSSCESDVVKTVHACFQARTQQIEALRTEKQDVENQISQLRAQGDAEKARLQRQVKAEIGKKEDQAERDARVIQGLKTQLQSSSAEQQQKFELQLQQQEIQHARAIQDLKGQIQRLQSQSASNSQQKERDAAVVQDLKKHIQSSANEYLLKTQTLTRQTQKDATVIRDLKQQLRLQAEKHWKLVNCWRCPVQPLNHVRMEETSLIELIQEKIASLSHTYPTFNGVHSKCAAMQNAKVIKVVSVHNPHLWKVYSESKEVLKSQHRSRGTSIRPLSPVAPCILVPGTIANDLDSSVNECFLFHGCSDEGSEEIIKNGFDARYADENGLYGEGIYFASEPCKSLQYSKPTSAGKRCMFVARVVLGDPAYLTGQVKGKLPPKRTDVQNAHFDSSVVNPDVSLRGQMHREFVVFENSRVYPELLIEFTAL